MTKLPRNFSLSVRSAPPRRKQATSRVDANILASEVYQPTFLAMLEGREVKVSHLRRSSPLLIAAYDDESCRGLITVLSPKRNKKVKEPLLFINKGTILACSENARIAANKLIPHGLLDKWLDEHDMTFDQLGEMTAALPEVKTAYPKVYLRNWATPDEVDELRELIRQSAEAGDADEAEVPTTAAAGDGAEEPPEVTTPAADEAEPGDDDQSEDTLTLEDDEEVVAA